MERLIAVERGVELLDERLPNWRNHVDVGRLNLANGSECVVGQLFGGDFQKGVNLLGVENRLSYYGFAAGRSNWNRLTGEWRRAIEEPVAA